MDLIFNPFSLSLIFSGLVVACLSMIIVFKLEDETKWVAITMILGAIWGFFYGLELASKTIESILFFIKLQYVGISFLAASWLYFTFKYTDTKLSENRSRVFFTFLIPVITFVLVLSLEQHPYFYKSYEIVSNGMITGIKTQVGPWYYVHLVYSYSAFILGNFIIWKRFRFSGQLFKTQTRLIFIAGLFPIVFNAFYQTGIFRPFELLDLTPYAFLLTYSILGIAIIRYHLFSIKPIAKNIIFEAITSGVLVLDWKNKIVDFNSAIFSFFNDEKIIKIGTNADEVFDQNPEILNLLKGLDKETIEIPFKTGEANRIAEIEVIPLIENDTIQNGTILLFEDITARVKTKELLVTQKTELEQLNNLKDKYFSIISHDLKGPIFGVKELIHLTQTGLISNEEFIELLPEISKNMENVSQLLENLLAWTSSQLRGEQVILETFDIIKVISHQQQLLSRIANEKHITIQIDVPDSEFKITGDKNMVDLILRNLINNAIKFSKPSSKVILSAVKEAAFTKICIEDFGTGISEENLQKINDGISFTTKGVNHESGTGLGLVLVREYIKKNDGKLHVESVEGKGSRFCVYLPSGF